MSTANEETAVYGNGSENTSDASKKRKDFESSTSTDSNPLKKLKEDAPLITNATSQQSEEYYQQLTSTASSDYNGNANNSNSNNQSESTPTTFNDGTRTNIFVNYLTPDINDQQLKAMFEPFGPVVSTKIMLDLGTKMSRGYGFVKFQSEAHANEAITKMNGVRSGNKFLIVKLAESKGEGFPAQRTPSTNLYVKGLPPGMTDEQLHTLFKPYGTIMQHKLLKDALTGVTRGQGFVRYDNLQSAEYAISSLSGYLYPGTVGKGLSVQFADSDSEKEERKAKTARRAMNDPFHFNPYSSWGNPSYSQYGGYQQPSVNQYQQHYGSYGATGYEDHTAQGGVGVGVGSMSRVQPHGHGMPPGLGMPPTMGGVGGGVPSGAADNNLFIYHLPPTADDTMLYKLFSPFGAIASVKIVKDLETGQCKGFGFVRMTTYAAAVSAIQGLNGVKIENKHLIISFKR